MTGIASVQEMDRDRVELPPVGTWRFDQAHTTVGFVARHMLSRVRGRFTRFDGQIRIGETPESSSVELTIDPSSIETGTQMRDDHLRSGDFLEIDRYPTMSFRSTAVRPTGGTSFDLDGELTIKDVTRPVTLHAEYLGWGPGLQGGSMMAFSGRTKIDREDWDMTWNVAVEAGGVLVGRTVDIEIEVEALLEE